MAYCKYHPTTASSFYCSHCDSHFCTNCVDHSVGGEARCFCSGQHVNYQVTEDSVEPFWRRLEKAFRYPLYKDAMMMIVGLSVLSAIVTAMPLPGLVILVLWLIIAGASVNYSFMCLTATSEGTMTPPNLADAFAGSLGILLKLFLLFVLAAAAIWAIGARVSPGLAIVAMMIFFVGIPAILMCFAHTDSVLASLNPMNFVGVMTKIGMPYLVLVMFLFIMVSSIGIVNSIIGQELPALSAILQSSVANYYAVVSFHLMGYLLYQYQDKLGFSTADDDEVMQKAEEEDVLFAHINIHLKEGEYGDAIELLLGALKTNQPKPVVWQRGFEMLYRLEAKQPLASIADGYFSFLVRGARTEQMLSDYKKVKQLLPKFLPKDPTVRLYIAHAAHAQGDSKTTVQLINGMHKQFPEFEKLVAAYTLMVSALHDIPNMESQAVKCQAMVSQLKQKYPDQSDDVSVNKPVTSEAKEPPAQKPVAPIEPASQPVGQMPAEPEVKEHAPIEFKL